MEVKFKKQNLQLKSKHFLFHLENFYIKKPNYIYIFEDHDMSLHS